MMQCLYVSFLVRPLIYSEVTPSNSSFGVDEDKRPAVPRKSKIPADVDDLIQSCWRREPLVRPHFSQVVRLLKKIIRGGDDILASPSVMLSERGPSAIFIGKEFEETAVAAAPANLHLPTTVLYTPSRNHSCASSISPNLASVEGLNEGYESLPPTGDVTSDMRNERLYRILLSHNFHPSRESMSLLVLNCVQC